jgi:mannose-1-phosphate guanylyltransferase
MVPVLNRPFLEHMFSYLKRHGIEDIVLAMGYLPDQIRDYFGEGSSFGVRLSYVVEDSPLGTAGGVKNAESYLDDQPFVVMNGDVFTNIDLGAMLAFHRERKAKATIALTEVEDTSRYGVVETDTEGRVARFVEKPAPGETTSHYINAGIYILEADVMQRVPSNTRFMFERDLFPMLLHKGAPVYGFPSKDYWIDMGTPGKYLELQRDLLEEKCVMMQSGGNGSQRFIALSNQSGKVVVGSDCRIGQGARIKGPTVLGPGCRIEDGAVIERAVLWSNVTVGRGARLINCIVGDDSIIGDECTLPEGSVLGSGCVVGRCMTESEASGSEAKPSASGLEKGLRPLRRRANGRVGRKRYWDKVLDGWVQDADLG